MGKRLFPKKQAAKIAKKNERNDSLKNILRSDDLFSLIYVSL